MRFLLLVLLAAPAFCDPHLLLNDADLARIQKLAATQTWAAHVIADLVNRAEHWPASQAREFGLKEWALPKEGSGWSHDYVCPVHGVRLRQEEGRNICPIDGKDYHGWPVDNVVYMMRNDANAAAARDLGLAFRLTGRTEFAEKARRIFNAYSALYPTLPIHDNQNRLNTKRGARVMSQTLSEAKWLVPLAFGYDLVRDAMPAEERNRFETQVLRNAAAVIARNDMGTSNWQSWHNAALLAAGLLTEDHALIHVALDGPGGFRFQMHESITPDGPWREGSWGYHFFALRPLLLTREMAARAGIAIPEAAALKRMLDAPLACVFPDGTLPNFNDSGLVKLDREAEYYDIGYRLFHDPRYVPLIRESPRGLDSLLWGAASLPAGQAPPLTSEVLPVAGIATLRVRGSDHTLAIKFGPHGGGHGHFDKLTFIDYANGAHLAADPGTQAYGAKTHATWDKMTVAHNTVVADEKSQAAATGRLLEWTPLPHVTEIRASAGPVYPNVEMERTMVQTDRYTLDVLDVRSTDSTTHRFDWMYHNFGHASTALSLQPYAQLPQTNGYQHLTDTRAARVTERWQATFDQPRCDLRLTMLGAPDTTVVFGEGLGPDLRVPVPFTMVRRGGTEARFVALYEPYTGTPPATDFRASGPGVFIVKLRNAVDTISVEPGKFSLERSVNGKPARLALSGIRHDNLADSSSGGPVEIDWPAEGGALVIYTPPDASGTLRIRAPQAKGVRLNDRPVESRREGEFLLVRLSPRH